MVIFMGLGILVGIAAVILILQNITPVAFDIFFWEFEGSLSVVLLLALFVGGLAVALIVLPSLVRARWQLSKLRSRNKKLEDTLMIDETPKASSAVPERVERDVVDL